MCLTDCYIYLLDVLLSVACGHQDQSSICFDTF